MTNIYVSWDFLKARVAEGKTLYYHIGDWNIQLYVLEGPDAYIYYIPRPDKFDQMVIDDETKNKSQNCYNDFVTNYKSNAVETEGVRD